MPIHEHVGIIEMLSNDPKLAAIMFAVGLALCGLVFLFDTTFFAQTACYNRIRTGGARILWAWSLVIKSHSFSSENFLNLL